MVEWWFLGSSGSLTFGSSKVIQHMLACVVFIMMPLPFAFVDLPCESGTHKRPVCVYPSLGQFTALILTKSFCQMAFAISQTSIFVLVCVFLASYL